MIVVSTTVIVNLEKDYIHALQEKVKVRCIWSSALFTKENPYENVVDVN